MRLRPNQAPATPAVSRRRGHLDVTGLKLFQSVANRGRRS